MVIIEYRGNKEKGIPPCPKRKHQTDQCDLIWFHKYYPKEYNRLAKSMHWLI